MTNMHYHLLASPLLRPNGIVEFIRAMIEANGGELWTNKTVPDSIGVPYKVPGPGVIKYAPTMKTTDWGNGPEVHPWLEWTAEVKRMASDMARLIKDLPSDATIYTHCAISEAGAQSAGRKSIFVQHESDIYYPENRLSYLADDWLAEHRLLMHNATIGATMPPTDAMAYHAAVDLPYPAQHRLLDKTDYAGDVVAFFDGSYRKGWDRYLRWWSRNGCPRTTVITKEPDTRWPSAWQTHGFAPSATAAKLQMIRNHCRAFVPSRSEVTCLALLECMSQVPTMVFESPWNLPYSHTVDRLPLDI